MQWELLFVAGLLFGLIPAIQQSRQRDTDVLREKHVSHRVRGTLVVAEIAMAVMLLVGGALLIHSFLRLSSVERGYNPTNVLTFQAAPQSRVTRGQSGVCRSPRLATGFLAWRDGSWILQQPAVDSAGLRA